MSTRRQPKKGRPVPDSDYEGAFHSGRSSDSPGNMDVEFERLTKKMMQATKNRRNKRREKLQYRHTQEAEQLEAKIITTFDNQLRSKQYRRQLTKLYDILKKRRDIEEQIWVHAVELESRHAAITVEFCTVLDGRIADMQSRPTPNSS
ncbi:hypothetical protein MMC09_003371 [Bachmanniomyces sp. S44760]|nr:hypothetical protein [Bachmanniomyces sp. S44760]